MLFKVHSARLWKMAAFIPHPWRPSVQELPGIPPWAENHVEYRKFAPDRKAELPCLHPEAKSGVLELN